MNEAISVAMRARRTTSGYRSVVAIAAIVLLSACDGSFDGDDSNKINGSIHVPAGRAATDVRTVNGSVHVDDDATVNSATTVNGSVRLGAHSTASAAKTVNGAISLSAGAHISGGASSVNGDLILADGSEVSGSLANVNGKIDLTAAHVGGGIRTVNGSIKIMGASHVDGGLVVEKGSGGLIFSVNDAPVIVVGPGASVQGELRFERKVRLYVSDKASIGTVTGATPISFTGDNPPN